ncbi:MAG: transcription antitermination protein NusB, partial [Clostridia bacterium]|nr:transcription antitermination protein NusB [Clostridia bacterium]
VDVEFAEKLYQAIVDNEEVINNDIAEISRGYSLDRIYSTDKCALKLAICEMRYFNDVPNIVAINEAMELVRKYSTPESPNFVNGILAEFKKRLEK